MEREDLACAGEVGVTVQFTGDPYGAFLLAPVVGLAFGLDEVRRAAGHDLIERQADIAEQGLLVALVKT